MQSLELGNLFMDEDDLQAAVLPVKSPCGSQGAILTQMEAEKGQLQCELQQVRRFGGWCVCINEMGNQQEATLKN